MSFRDFVPLVQSLPTILRETSTAVDAWREIRERERAVGRAATELPDGDIDAEVAVVAEQLERVFRESPLPPGLQLLCFGLFAAANPETFEEEAGYYVGGSTRELSFTIDSSAELAGDVEDYQPENRYLDSPLLQRIKVAALATDADYDRYDYAVMLGAAAVLSLYALRRLGMSSRLVVGFDSGDAVDLRA